MIFGFVFWLIKKFLPSQAIERYLNISNNSRIPIWRDTFEYFKMHPIFGGGMGSVSQYVHEVEKHVSHNVYLDILGCFGIVGSLLFLIFIIENCIKCKKNDLFKHFSLSIGFLLPMFFINGFNTATFYLPLIILSLLSQKSLKGEYPI